MKICFFSGTNIGQSGSGTGLPLLGTEHAGNNIQSVRSNPALHRADIRKKNPEIAIHDLILAENSPIW